jgi:hypothetical protein
MSENRIKELDMFEGLIKGPDRIKGHDMSEHIPTWNGHVCPHGEKAGHV